MYLPSYLGQRSPKVYHHTYSKSEKRERPLIPFPVTLMGHVGPLSRHDFRSFKRLEADDDSDSHSGVKIEASIFLRYGLTINK